MVGARERLSQDTRRNVVLDTLRAASDPVGVTELAERIGIHPNTVRFHLDSLVSDGVVHHEREESTGPGRPRTVYSARPRTARTGHREYRLLAEILLSRWTSDSATELGAVDTGRAWGRHLVSRTPPFHRPSEEESLTRLTDMLAELGFEPHVEGGDSETERIRLWNCPFLELAEDHTDTVCPLHLGLMQGALAEIDAPLQTDHLEPFTESGTCLARLTSIDEGRAPTSPTH